MVEPLKARTMTLPKLQLATLDLIRKVRFQLNRNAHEDGMSDTEFMENVLDPLESRLYADRWILRQARKAEKK